MEKSTHVGIVFDARKFESEDEAFSRIQEVIAYAMLPNVVDIESPYQATDVIQKTARHADRVMQYLEDQYPDPLFSFQPQRDFPTVALALRVATGCEGLGCATLFTTPNLNTLPKNLENSVIGVNMRAIDLVPRIDDLLISIRNGKHWDDRDAGKWDDMHWDDLAIIEIPDFTRIIEFLIFTHVVSHVEHAPFYASTDFPKEWINSDISPHIFF